MKNQNLIKNKNMNKITTRLMPLLTLFLIINSSCAMTPKSTFDPQTQTTKYQKPFDIPVSVPIDITKKGSKLELVVNVKEYAGYAFELQFFYDDPRRSKYEWINTLKSFFPNKKHSVAEWDEIDKDMVRVKKLVGGNIPENPVNPGGNWINYPGIPAPIHLTITKIENDGSQRVVFDKVRNPIKWGSGSSVAFYKIFAGYLAFEPKETLFLPGVYKVSIEALKDSPELIGTNISLFIQKEFYGK